MTQDLHDINNLRSYYDDVIRTHKDLANVFSSLAPTVVDGRLPDHGLAATLRNLAEREKIMADNWILVRDGLLDKIVRDA